jgi:uncharacterized damage-inducible protein DinB
MITVDYSPMLFDYNYRLHSRLWESIASLSDEQFTEEIPYSIGSIRNHIHQMNALTFEQDPMIYWWDNE